MWTAPRISRTRQSVAAWIIAALILLPLAARLSRSAVGTNPVAGTESAEFDRIIQRDFNSAFGRPAILVISGLALRADSDPGRAAIRAIVAPLLQNPAVVAVVSPGSSLDTLLVGRDGTTAIAIVGLSRDIAVAMDSVRAVTRRHEDALHRDHPSLSLRWTGEPAIVGDVRTFGAREARRAELRALPVSVPVAIFAFGSIAAAAIALGVATLAVIIALGLTGLLSGLVAPSAFTPAMIPLVGFALTIDYVLFLRRRVAEGSDPSAARRTVFLAGGMVSIGFAGMAIAPTGELRSAAVAGIVTSMIAACAAVALTPANIVHHRFAAESQRFRRWGTFVVANPVLVLCAAAVPLVALANAARSARLATPVEHLLPPGMESAEAYRDLTRAGRAAVAASARVLVALPVGRTFLSDEGWNALSRATATFGAAPGAAGVRSLATIGNRDLFGAQHVLPAVVLDAYLSTNRSTAIVDVYPRDTTPAAARAMTAQLRELEPERVTGMEDSRIVVAGLPAYALDYEVALGDAIPDVVIAVSLATFIALAVALRAPLAAFKAVALNLLVAAAAIGASTLIFQEFRGVSSMFPTVPLLAFGAAFGTSMDYELFLLSAVRDARDAGLGDTEAIVAGIARTGGLIMRAALVMACLCVAFSASTFLPLAMVGTTLAIAVVLDATIVRLALAPALLRIAGRWNWWPGRLD